MSKKTESLEGLRVTIMGLGLHGGGIEAALYFARNGARVTVTDLKDETFLAGSVAKLEGFPIRFVLGRHETEDFADTDLVIKNPGVPKTSKFLQIASAHGVPVESDISVFVTRCANPLFAVTGSKGKSTVASAIHYCLIAMNPDARLGGNITVSPLSFARTVQPDSPVVLELSSWQLADLASNACFKPRVSLITNILPDHLNWYGNMDDYLADKKIIYKYQDADDVSIFNLDDPLLAGLGAESRATSFYFSCRPLPRGVQGAFLDGEEGYLVTTGSKVRIIGEQVKLPGHHNRLNLLAAGLVCSLAGADQSLIAERLADFPGIEHRLELFFAHGGITFYNDSAATIPHATVAALSSLKEPVHLITGGTDKNIDFTPLFEAARVPAMIYLLAGNATEKIVKGLSALGVAYRGPFESLEEAVREALQNARGGESVLFSPACASFGMFQNEFDRGRKFKACVHSMFDRTP